MPIIRIDWDNDKITESKATELSIAAKKIVAEVTGIGDVFVYANSSQIKIDIAPIEIFIEMSANKIENAEELIRKIKDKL